MGGTEAACGRRFSEAIVPKSSVRYMASTKDILLGQIRSGGTLSGGQQLKLCLMLSYPAIIAQLSSVLMQYIDTSMVGHLGAAAGASIGLVSTCL